MLHDLPGSARQLLSSGTRGAQAVKLSVVLPVYNEVDVLPRLMAALDVAVGVCDVADCEYIFVNDGSTDATPGALDRLAAQSSRVRVLHLSRNFGHQAAVQAGLAGATGDAVVVMDSDLQDAPAAIPAMLAAWRNGYDVVFAIRTDRKEAAWKRWCFTAFYRALASVSATPIPLDAGNFGLMDRRVLQAILGLSERDRYFPGLRSWVGFRQIGIPVERGSRYDRVPRVSLRGLMRLAKTAVFSFSSFPLTLFYVIGGLALTLFCCLSAFSLYCRLFTDLAIPGWTSHVLIGCFFGALNALGVSILGEYVIRIYDQVRSRPLYLVEREVGGVKAAGISTQSAKAAAGNEFDELYAQVLADVESLAQTASGANRKSGKRRKSRTARAAKPTRGTED